MKHNKRKSATATFKASLFGVDLERKHADGSVETKQMEMYIKQDASGLPNMHHLDRILASSAEAKGWTLVGVQVPDDNGNLVKGV